MMKPTAVFLDRDGTIIEDVGYIGDPDQVRLIPGVAAAIRRLAQAGHLVVIVSNQSGVARGRFDEQALSRVHARVEALLHEQDAKLDGAYYCPYLDGPEAVVEAYRRDSELRKPRPGMLLQAAQELDIDLLRSWMIGDSIEDVEAGRRSGCQTVRLAMDGTDEREGAREAGITDGPDDADERNVDLVPTHTVRSLSEAASLIERAGAPSRDDRDAAGESASPDETVAILKQIHELLQRAKRHEGQQDFSILRLLGALLQMIAMVVGLWGLIALVDGAADQAAARFAGACFLQLASISSFAIDRFR